MHGNTYCNYSYVKVYYVLKARSSSQCHRNSWPELPNPRERDCLYGVLPLGKICIRQPRRLACDQEPEQIYSASGKYYIHFPSLIGEYASDNFSLLGATSSDLCFWMLFL